MTKTSSLIVALLAACLPLLLAAPLRAYTHIGRTGETLTQLANRYYGNPDLATVIRAANGFLHPDDGSLTQGERVEVPELTYHRVLADESWAKLADRYLASAKRGRFLAEMNGLDPNRPPTEGMIIKVPYNLRHVFAKDESLKSVIKMYYTDTGTSATHAWLVQYNLTRRKRFGRGDVLLVPLIDIEFTDEEKARLEAERSLRYTQEDARSQEQAVQGIADMKANYDNGKYVEIVATGERLLGTNKLKMPQQLAIFKLLAFSYVALGNRPLALRSFTAALELQPGMDLSPITTSPKILEVYRAARDAALHKTKKEENSNGSAGANTDGAKVKAK